MSITIYTNYNIISKLYQYNQKLLKKFVFTKHLLYNDVKIFKAKKKEGLILLFNNALIFIILVLILLQGLLR